ncbi:MAG: helix-turn-helix domain-containing protein [Candidatus Staskawiczbacteria bacterium]|nr:helix-turn-helix domain-containing protein [Candidatus Staskawiczbacteria bacterium]
MEHKYKIKDESGDKKYFTQIPNMIVNHSTAYEQSLYLIMKRLAGEGGQCYASLNFLASKMGIHKTTVTKTIAKLLKRKWIEETSKTKVPGGFTRTFIIIDLWKLNIDNYGGGAEMTTGQPLDDQCITPGGGAIKNGGGAVVDGGGAQTDTSKIKNKIKEEETANSSSFKRKRYYGRLEMRFAQGKWWVIPEDGGDWLEFDMRFFKDTVEK